VGRPRSSRRHHGLALALLLLVACAAPAAPAASPPSLSPAPAGAGSAPPASSTPASAAQPPREVVRVGVLHSISDAPLIAGREHGYYSEEGLDLEFYPFDSAQQMIPALGTGQLDAGGGAPGPGLINAYLRGVQLRVVADRAQATPGTRGNCLAIRKELLDSGAVQRFADLRGRVFAENVPGNLLTYVLEQELRKAGVSPEEVTYTTVPFPDMVPGFANGVIDAALLSEPQITLGESRGAFGCWRYTSDLAPGFQIGVFLYGPSFIGEHPELGRRFMVGYVRGMRDYYRAFLGDGAGRAEMVTLLTQNTAIKDPALLERMAPNGFDPDARVNAQSLQDTQRWYLERGAIPTEVDINELVDQQFVDYALTRLGRYPR